MSEPLANNPDDIIEPNGLPAWENNLLGISDEDRNTPAIDYTSEDLDRINSYCYELLPNGKSAFDNDILGTPQEERYRSNPE